MQGEGVCRRVSWGFLSLGVMVKEGARHVVVNDSNCSVGSEEGRNEGGRHRPCQGGTLTALAGWLADSVRCSAAAAGGRAVPLPSSPSSACQPASQPARRPTEAN